jgi:catechol 2,3-dioxygenase-like lactoylglutathione lyase family enzyme
MDHRDENFPGHTQMSFEWDRFQFGVGSVPGVQAYFEEQAIPLSGTRVIPGRGTVSIFVRDPDGTILEFERNDGVDDGAVETSKTLSNAPRGGIDHIGTCVSNPEVAFKWYVKVFGFGETIMKAELDTTWIVRTQHGDGDIDINLIVNFFWVVACWSSNRQSCLVPVPVGVPGTS